jgi:hypothetical protein
VKADVPFREPVTSPATSEIQGQREVSYLGGHPDAVNWFRMALDLEPKLAGFGSVYLRDPSAGFCLQSSRRETGDFEGARKLCAAVLHEHQDGPWHDAAEAELWLPLRKGECPKPLLVCRPADERPFLDGKLDDPCWQKAKPTVLRDAVGGTGKDYPTEVWVAYDRDFLYLALRCKHPADRHVEPVKTRGRDSDLRAYDRVSLMLDVDRDYTTSFNLHVDQRGCLADDCWGDATWNPRWFVAVHSEPTVWQVEAAIPLHELAGGSVKPGTAWACNVVRVLPGRGVQACSLPADATPRPEGMGLLLFLEPPTPAKP